MTLQENERVHYDIDNSSLKRKGKVQLDGIEENWEVSQEEEMDRPYGLARICKTPVAPKKTFSVNVHIGEPIKVPLSVTKSIRGAHPVKVLKEKNLREFDEWDSPIAFSPLKSVNKKRKRTVKVTKVSPGTGKKPKWLSSLHQSLPGSSSLVRPILSNRSSPSLVSRLLKAIEGETPKKNAIRTVVVVQSVALPFIDFVVESPEERKHWTLMCRRQDSFFDGLGQGDRVEIESNRFEEVLEQRLVIVCGIISLKRVY